MWCGLPLPLRALADCAAVGAAHRCGALVGLPPSANNSKSHMRCVYCACLPARRDSTWSSQCQGAGRGCLGRGRGSGGIAAGRNSKSIRPRARARCKEGQAPLALPGERAPRRSARCPRPSKLVTTKPPCRPGVPPCLQDFLLLCHCRGQCKGAALGGNTMWGAAAGQRWAGQLRAGRGAAGALLASTQAALPGPGWKKWPEGESQILTHPSWSPSRRCCP